MKILISTATAALLLSASFCFAQPAKDSELSKVQSLDSASRSGSGSLPVMSLTDHMYRADVYMSNRQFPSARAHWEIVLEQYPEDPAIPKALFGMGR